MVALNQLTDQYGEKDHSSPLSVSPASLVYNNLFYIRSKWIEVLNSLDKQTTISVRL